MGVSGQEGLLIPLATSVTSISLCLLLILRSEWSFFIIFIFHSEQFAKEYQYEFTCQSFEKRSILKHELEF